MSAFAGVADSAGFDDPFRWLETLSPAVRKWQRDQHERARGALDRVGDRAALERTVAALIAADDEMTPVRGGGSWFRLCRSSAPAPYVTVAAEPGGQERRLVGAEQLADGPTPEIDWIAPSPDGKWAALGASTRGDERTVLRFVEASSGRLAPAALRLAFGATPAWLPDASAVCCLASDADADGRPSQRLVMARPDGAVEALAELPSAPAQRVALQLSPDGRRLALLADPFAPRLTHLLDRADGRWQAVPTVAPGTICAGAFVGDRYVAVTTADAPRGRIVAAPLAQLGDAAAWRELARPVGEEVIRAVAAIGDELVVCALEDGCFTLRLLAADGSALGAVPLPGPGTVCLDPLSPGQYGTAAPVRADAAGLLFGYATADRSAVVLRYDRASGTTRPLTQPRRVLDGIRVDRLRCRSADGALVRAEVVGPDRFAADVPRPTLLVAYGGWNAVAPQRGFLGPFAPFVAAGGRVVFAHVRGDATFGADVWHAGRRGRKQGSFDDVHALAEELLRRGTTAAGGLGIWGASNGGLLVAAAITQRPELFDAAVALVPLTDMGRFDRDPFAAYFTTEYGDPQVPAEAAWLRTYSPYHQCVEGTDYPPTLIVCGAHDSRIDAWHGRKLAARMQRTARRPEQILLRVHDDLGHLLGVRRGPPSVVAEWLAFAADRLGLAPVTRRATS